MITLTAKWHDPLGGLIFPVGTVFIPQRNTRNGTVYTYGTPDGGHGECLFYTGTIPGQTHAAVEARA